MKSEKKKNDSDKLVTILREYLTSSRSEAQDFQDKASDVWDMIHGRIDWSDKDETMAKIHLNKVGLAHERGKAQFKKSMLNFDEWMTVEQQVGMESELLSDAEAKRFVKVFIDDCDYKSHIAECFGNAMVENVCAAKLHTTVKETKYGKKVEIELIPLNIRNYFFDTFGGNLYEFHEINYDKYQLLKLASEKPTPSKPYYLDRVKALNGILAIDETLKELDKGNDEPAQKASRRQNIVLHEFYGTVLDDNGEVLEWIGVDGKSFPLENVVITMANEMVIIDDPRPFPRLDGESPFVRAKMLHSNDTQYGKSLLYPGFAINKAQDQLTSAMTDASMRAMLNLIEIKRSLLSDPSQVDGGFNYNQPIIVNDNGAPGEKAVSVVVTGNIPSEVFSISSMLDREVAENIGMTEFQLSGGRAGGQSSATAQVQSQQTFEGLFDGVAMDLEDTFIEPLITKVFKEGLRYASLLSDDSLMYIFGRNKPERMEAFKQAAKKPEVLYKELGGNFTFRGKGIRGLMRNTRIAQSLTQFVGMLGGIPPLMDQAERSFSFAKTFAILLKGYGIDPDEVAPTEQELQALEARQAAAEQAMLMQQQQEGAQSGPGNANPPAPRNSQNFEPGSGAGQ